MSIDTMIAMSGLSGLAAAVLTGALWRSPVLSMPSRMVGYFRSEGRHAMR